MLKKAVLIFLILAPFVYALEPLINQEYFTGDTIIIHDIPYTVFGSDSSGDYWNNYSSVIFKNNITKEMFKVSIGKCKDIKYYSFCYEDNYYNWDKRRTWEGSILEPSLKIKIYYKTPEVKLTRTNNVELEYGKYYLMDISFENTGVLRTTVNYEEEIPNYFVADCDFCINNKISLKVYLNPNEKKNFNYNVKPLTYDNYSWSYKYYYIYDNNNISSTGTITATVKKPYNIIEVSPKNNLLLEEETVYKINVSSVSGSALNINISISSDLIKKYSGLTFNGKKYVYEGAIPAKDSKIFEVTLSSPNIGYYPLIINSTIIADNKKFYYNNNYSLNISLKPIVASFIVDKEAVNPGENVFVIVKLKNTDEKENYLHVYSYVSGIDSYNYIPYLSANKEIIIYNGTIKAPVDDDLYLILKGIYRTRTLQELSFNDVKIIDVIGVEPKNISEQINNINDITFNNTPITEEIVQNNINKADQGNNQEQTNNVLSSSEQNKNTQAKDSVQKNTSKDNFISRLIKSFDSFLKKLFKK
ncbi:MAG: hypothetical protein QXL18_04355 [Candidatus Woesearchaeota archaeon]